MAVRDPAHPRDRHHRVSTFDSRRFAAAASVLLVAAPSMRVEGGEARETGVAGAAVEAAVSDYFFWPRIPRARSTYSDCVWPASFAARSIARFSVGVSLINSLALRNSRLPSIGG
jgi:hypothetical protein